MGRACLLWGNIRSYGDLTILQKVARAFNHVRPLRKVVDISCNWLKWRKQWLMRYDDEMQYWRYNMHDLGKTCNELQIGTGVAQIRPCALFSIGLRSCSCHLPRIHCLDQPLSKQFQGFPRWILTAWSRLHYNASPCLIMPRLDAQICQVR